MQSPHDNCLFIEKIEDVFMILLVYVYDLLITGPELSHIDVVKKSLYHSFTIKDLGPVKYYLGLGIARSTDGMFISQHKYIEDLCIRCKDGVL